MAGRELMFKAIALTVSSYPMHCFRFPTSVQGTGLSYVKLRDINNSHLCSICKAHLETIEHALLRMWPERQRSFSWRLISR